MELRTGDLWIILESMSTVGKTGTLAQDGRPFDAAEALPGLLVAFAPAGALSVDRCLLKFPFTVGRGTACSLPVREAKISKTHFCISRQSDGTFIEDIGSTNGTFVNGLQVTHKQRLETSATIRAGQSVFVYHGDARGVLESTTTQRFGIVGRFHSGMLLQELQESVLSGRHLFLTGPSGAGKELSARAVAYLMGKEGKSLPLMAHNAARFSSEEEAASTLFGVAPRAVSHVDERKGLIESANGGVLFLDEIHNLPIRVQRTLLRVIEDGKFSRIGNTALVRTNVRYVFASNDTGPNHGIAPDLLARLRVCHIPSLSERVADIPTIFNHLLEKALTRQHVALERVLPMLKGDHYESMCVDRFPVDNVRGLMDLADRISTRVAAGTDPKTALASIFSSRFSKSPVASRYTDANAKKSTAFVEKK